MIIVSHQVTPIPGDSIGPEAANATMRAVDASGAPIAWERLWTRKVLPANVIASLARTRVGLKGPVTTPIASGFTSVNVALRKALDLFANVSSLEHEVVKDVVTRLKAITRTASLRIANYAFNYARRHG
jgi:isocitrate dehydrogenase (NAD+)